jgi:aminotransferase EvaB
VSDMSDTLLTRSGTIQGNDGELSMIPMNDLRRQTEAMRGEIDRVVADVISSGWYVLGPHVSAFEEEFALFCGVRHVIGVANGTEALELALRAVDRGRGKEVITVANAGMYSTVAILATGAIPIFADIDPSSLTMSPESLKFNIGARTAAVVVTHLYGRLADMSSLMDVADNHGVPVIEDCAHAHGAERDGRKAGTFGTVGCFSFYPTKNLGALGDGGAVLTNDERLAANLRSLRQYGWHAKYQADRPYGRNSRLDELQAAVLRLKLPHLDAWNARRRDIIGRYRNAAGDAVRIPDASGSDHVGHLCVARSPRRTALQDALKHDGIATDIHYPVPDHRQEALKGIIPNTVCLPVTEAAAAEILTLPCFPELSEEEVARVCRGLTRFARQEQAA